jgi:single-strand DNA-binding protein
VDYIIIEGNLTRDPELKFSQSNSKPYCFFTVAVSYREQRNGSWQDVGTCYYSCTAFGKMAENITESLTKGNRVVVAGRKTTEFYTAKDGSQRTNERINVDHCGLSLQTACARVMANPNGNYNNQSQQGGYQPQPRGNGYDYDPNSWGGNPQSPAF